MATTALGYIPQADQNRSGLRCGLCHADGKQVIRRRRRAGTVLLFCVVLVCGSTASAELSGYVYEGQTGVEPPTAKPIAGVTVTLYGSNDINQQGTFLSMGWTGSDGSYELLVHGAFDYYNIVQTNKAGYIDSTPSPAATSVGGTVRSSNWIQYSYQDLFGTTTGNKFWDKLAGPPNRPPTAIDDSYSIAAGGNLYVGSPGVLSNDSDPEGHPLTAKLVSGPSNGTVTLNPDGSFSYTPNPGFSGTDTFTYRANDGDLDSNIATVAIDVLDDDYCTINVYKWEDKDGDCVWDQPGEQGLANWKICLDNNQNCQCDPGEPFKLTDATGWCSFDVPCQGTYYLAEETKPGWERVCPAMPPCEVHIHTASPLAAYIVWFGNRRVAVDEYDYGDAPDSYGTLKASGGAWHIVDDTLHLGPTVDTESDGKPTTNAQGDDNAGTDDEDGMVYCSVNCLTGFIELTISNDGSMAQKATLAGWIDFDGSKQFDSWSSEMIGSVQLTVPAHGTINHLFHFPVVNAVPGLTYARFRLYWIDPDPMAPAWALLPAGGGPKGEVEDYQIEIVGEFGDAPEGAIAYPSAGVIGKFPTCKGGPAGYIYHKNPDVAYFGGEDGEIDGNGGKCAGFPPYDQDEGFNDGDAGLIKPEPYTINAQGKVVPCAGGTGTPLGRACGTAMWGSDIDISVNDPQGHMFVNVLIDWNQDGKWGGASSCPGGGTAPEHVLVNAVLPPGSNLGKLSSLLAGNIPFQIGPKPGYVWARFTISDTAVPARWDGSGTFNFGETEDYLLYVGGEDFGDAPDIGMPDYGPLVTPPPNGLLGTTGFMSIREVVDNGVIADQWACRNSLNNTVQPAFVADYMAATLNIEDGGVPGHFGNDAAFGVVQGGQKVYGLVDDLSLQATGAIRIPTGGVYTFCVSSDDGFTLQFPGYGSFSYPGDRAFADSLGTANLPAGDHFFILTYHEHGGVAGLELSAAKGAKSAFDSSFQLVGSPGGLQLVNPPSYPTLLLNNGAHHTRVSDFHLGQAVDDEPDGQPSPHALGDDNNGTPDDEDGVDFLTPIVAGSTADLKIVASAPGFVDAWIDFDCDGNWNLSSDQILDAEPVKAGDNLVTIVIPASAQSDVATFARFRLSRTGGLPCDGDGQDGEVEDYRILLGSSGPSVPGEGEGQPPHVKWSQPPIEINPDIKSWPVYCGWDESSLVVQRPGQPRTSRVALDDFHCLGAIPITRVRWWGSYQGWDAQVPPAVQPASWLITFWANVPGGRGQMQVVHRVEVPGHRVELKAVASDAFPQKPSDACFRYEVSLQREEWFDQAEFETEDDRFWISITAAYPDNATPRYEWGWKTRPEVWQEAAKAFSMSGSPALGFIPDPRQHGLAVITNNVLCNRQQGYDLCFELLTEDPWVKWDQPFLGLREWAGYADHASMASESPRGDLTVQCRVADDWVCEGPGPIVAIAWHGSYLGYGYEACDCRQAVEPRRPDYFLLSIWTDAPPSALAPGHRPGGAVWEYAAYDYDEVLVGYDRDPDGEPNEPVFRYSVRVPRAMQFQQEAAQTVYWFSVVAVFADAPAGIPYSWGWTNHEYTFGSPALTIDYRSGARPAWRDTADRAAPVDMSFTLFTAAQPGPVAHWRFDEGQGSLAVDSAGGHDGTIHGARWTQGRLDGALAFDGDDYVDVPHAADLNITGALTVAAWVRTQDAGSGRHIPYVTKGDRSYALKHQWQNNLEFFIYDGDWRVVHVPVDSSFNGVWHHLAGTYDGAQLRLYVDGVLKATQDHIGSIAPSLFNVNIGRNSECVDRFYRGQIDDVRLYDCVLTVEQIQDLLQGPGAGLRAHWKLDETAGATAQDSVGNYHGTVQGNPLWRPQGGEIGGALEFDGNGDGVVIPKVGESVAFTYALWVKQNVIGRELIALIDHKQWVPGSVHFELRDGHPKVGINGVIWPEGDLDAPAYTLGVGAWYHLALTKSASEMALYVNGELAAHRPLTMSGSVILGDGSLGRWLDPAASRPRDFNGLLDEVRIYDRALSVEEIRRLAGTGAGN